MEYFDNIGNKLEIGDEVLILVPKSDATYRHGIVKDFKNKYSDRYCEVLVEYDEGRLYCNQKRWEQSYGGKIMFTKKITKAWRSNSDIIKFKPEYLDV